MGRTMEKIPKWMIVILQEMFDRVGELFTEDYVKEEGWWLKHEWTKAQEQSFQDWLYRHLRRHKPWKSMSQYKMKGEIGYFMLSYGWKHKEGE
jgi:hypothetical protein